MPSPATLSARCGSAAKRMRHDGMVDLVGVLTKKARLRKGVTKAHAADVLYLLLGPDLRVWSPTVSTSTT